MQPSKIFHYLVRAWQILITFDASQINYKCVYVGDVLIAVHVFGGTKII